MEELIWELQKVNLFKSEIEKVWQLEKLSRKLKEIADSKRKIYSIKK